mmetsp:Transcript_62202/g.71303  ORF Transcript_62202/g.71303 Transcript_62202/m.71303 type:complete len:233 (-) Transcript_62202:303-1001(-)
MYGAKYAHMTLELNASDERGINVVRDQIKNFCSTQQLISSGIKLVVLDEADSMTSAAQFALRRIIEKSTKTTRFCIICNYVSKIIPALQSRCTRFRFGPLSGDEQLQRLTEIAETEKLSFDEGGLRSIIKLSDGDMRRALNLMQSASMTSATINKSTVYTCAGKPHPDDIELMMKSVLNDQFETAYRGIMNVKAEKGISLLDMIREFHRNVIAMELPTQVKIALVRRMAEIE